MNQFDEIIGKYKEFSTYLGSVNLDRLRKQHSREELKKLSSEMNSIKLRSLEFEVDKMIDEMKKEEFPELLGVHRFPVLKKIDFLTEDEKIALDKHLLMIRKGNYVYGLHNVTRGGKITKIFEFLIENEVVETEHFALCPGCGNGYISSKLNSKLKKQIEEVINDKNIQGRMDVLERYLEYICMECDKEINLEFLTSVNFSTAHKLIIDRDKTLDNV